MLRKMKNKFLIIPNNTDEVFKLKENGYNSFLFPLKFFSVGFKNYFEISDITFDNSYLYVNRVLTSFDIDKLCVSLKDLAGNIKGIVFEDVGLVEALKDFEITKILYANHMILNKYSVNEYLKYVDSVVVSPDITLSKLEEIISFADKKVCVFGYGHLMLSYSRRILLSNYAKAHNLEFENDLCVSNTDFKFLLSESDEGTIIYDKEVYSSLDSDVNLDNVLFVIASLYDVRLDDFLNNKYDTTGFLDKETIYKLKGGE